MIADPDGNHIAFAEAIDTLHRAVDQSRYIFDAVLAKARFWQRWATTPLNKAPSSVLIGR